MPLVKVGTRHQVTIPKSIVDRLGLRAGDYVEVRLEDGRIIITPKEIVDKTHSWFWAPEWQEGIQEALEDLKAGRVVGPFERPDDALKALDDAEI
jgi:AbrB family looped-hinge helix DNA binding protein